MHERDVHDLAERHHLQHRAHLLQHLDRPRSGSNSAVAREPDRLVPPFRVQVVDRVLDRCIEPVVVLGEHEDERIAARDGRAPCPGVLVDVLTEPRMLRFVEHRQADLGQVDQLDVKRAVRYGSLIDPCRHGRPDPARPGAGDNDLQCRFRHRFTPQASEIACPLSRLANPGRYRPGRTIPGTGVVAQCPRLARQGRDRSSMNDTARSVLVTGASAGIGTACAGRLHAAGWSVTGASRRGTSSGGWTGPGDGCR